MALDQQEALADIFYGGGLALDAGLAVFAQVFFDNGLDFLGHGGAKKGPLGVFGNFAQDGFHIFHESHVQHLVGFVQDDGLDLVQRDGTPLNVVDKASRGGHNHIGGALEGTELYGDILPTVNGNHMDLGEFRGVLLYGLCHLDGKFAGGGQHQQGGFF